MEQNVYAVYGLKRKRAEVSGQILTLEHQLKTLKADLLALDRSLQIMDAKIDPSKIKPIKPRQRILALYFVHGDGDHGQVCPQRGFVGGKQSAAGDSEILAALFRLATEAQEAGGATGAVSAQGATGRANSLALCLGPADFAEGCLGFLFRHTEDLSEAQGFCRF